MKLKRRDFFYRCAGWIAAVRCSAHAEEGFIHTVLGRRSPDDLGITLMHEHVMVDFIGAEKVSRDRYEPEDVFRVALPFLKKVRELGCRTIVECTPAYIGRDAALLRKLSEASGVTLITNTGYYGAANDNFVPGHAYQETAEELAGRWIKEFRDGIENTGIKPGIMKIGVDKGPLSSIDEKLVRASAIAHRATGLTIASHTGDGEAALAELRVLEVEGVSPDAFIWVHAQNESNPDLHVQAAHRGAWVEFDGIRPETLDRHLKMVRNMMDRGLLKRTLISQDAGWYHVGEPGGGRFRNYAFLFTDFVPELRKKGATEGQVQTLLVDNPRQALTTRIRTL
ncbi:MAG: phosphotriesterase [Acidobacteria bacterium]|nr:phosphotriesterase [Acidobacteriota bacterium]